VSEALYQFFAWPCRCTRSGCNRRPRQAFVQAEVDETGNPQVKFHAVCNGCRGKLVATIAQANVRKGSN
jgi:hypothetical protein